MSNGSLALSGSGSLAGAVELENSGAGLNISGISGSGTSLSALSGVAGSTATLGGKALTVGSANTSTVFAGAISGSSGSLTKTGTGTLTLSGSNTYTGTTTVSGGKLIVNGSTSSSSSVSVASGAILEGSGTIGGNTTIQGTHSPGNSPGIQTFSGNLTYGSSSIFEWDINANAIGTRGTDYDGVTVSGNLTVEPGAVFRVVQNSGVNFSNVFWDTNQAWTNIFNVSGSAVGWGNNTSVSVYNTSGQTVDVTTQGFFTVTGTSLSWTAIPEPSSVFVAGCLVGSGLLRRRRA